MMMMQQPTALGLCILLVWTALNSCANADQTMALSPPPPPPLPLPNPGMIFPGDGRHTGGHPSMPGSTDCAIRQAAYAYGKKLQPQKGGFRDLFDALQLGNGCGLPPPLAGVRDEWMPPQASPKASDEPVLFVEPWKPLAAETTTHMPEELPVNTFPSVAAAVAASRSMQKPLTVALREGTHYISETIQLGPADSGLTLRNADGQKAVLSGGKPLSPAWKPSAACAGCFEASLQGQVSNVPGLRKDGVREIRARYPNHDPELNAVIGEKYLVHDGRAGLLNLTKVNASTWIPAGATMNGMNESWPPAEPATTFVVDGTDWPGVDWPDHIMSVNHSDPAAPLIPDRDTWTGEGDWGQYWLGVGGPCADRYPPAGYWCAPRAPRRISQPNHAAGIVLSATQLPNFPYKRNPAGAVINAWGKDHWYTNIFEIGETAPANRSNNSDSSQGYYFSRGGTQGGEGVIGGEEWYIEGVLEELDIGREWFFDNQTLMLYYKPNSTTTEASTGSPPTGEFVATAMRVLLNVTGTQATPAHHIAIKGLTIRDTTYSYFEPHGLPSGGDWALAPQGAITLVGTENITIEGNLLTRLDGNAIFIGGYNRNLTVESNEFEFIGENAMASWGETSTKLNDAGTKIIPWPIGPDGRDGNQPIGTRIIGNIVKECGVWQKQSSPWFQAITAKTLLRGNVFYNVNDGFGGGDEVTENLVLNMVRESKDHGPWNSWDRVPYITTLRNGSASTVPADRHIHHNFIIANYNSEGAIDTDDGSAYYSVHDNFFAMGANGLKSDFGGHDNKHHQNIYAFVSVCFGAPMPFRYFHGFNDAFVNNTCIAVGQGLGVGVYSSDCLLDQSWNVSQNRILTQTGQADICGKPWAQWYSPDNYTGRDFNSSLGKWPSDRELLEWVEALLNFHVNSTYT